MKNLIELLRGKSLVSTVTFTSSMAFLLFGYDNGLLSGLITLDDFLSTVGYPNSSLLGFIVAVYELGCLFGAVIISIFGEQLGRKPVTNWGSIILIIGTAIQASSYGRAQMIVGRIITGIGMGFLTSSVPVWQAEISQAHHRGRLVGCMLSMLIVGIVVAYWVDYGTSAYQNSFSWRFPIALQSSFAFVMLFACLFLPESPRWLAAHDRSDDALQVICQLRDGVPEDEKIRQEYEEILEIVADEQTQTSTWADCFRDGGIMGWQRVAITCGVQALQEFTGTNVITYYATYVMKNSVGLDGNQSLLLSGGLQLWFLVASIIPWFINDNPRFGRRKMFIVGSLGMGACFLIAGVLIRGGTRSQGIGAVAMLYLFQGFFTWGWMSNMWVYPSEILPLKLRQRGGALGVVFQWLTTFFIVEITPVAISNIGWKFYAVFLPLNWGAIPLVYWYFPDTTGRSLESIDFLFAGAKNLHEVVKRSRSKEYSEAAIHTQLHPVGKMEIENVENVENV